MFGLRGIFFLFFFVREFLILGHSDRNILSLGLGSNSFSDILNGVLPIIEFLFLLRLLLNRLSNSRRFIDLSN